MMNNTKTDVPLWYKVTLSFKEAACLTGVGEQRLRALADRNPELVINIDSKKRMKRIKLIEWLQNHNNL